MKKLFIFIFVLSFCAIKSQTYTFTPAKTFVITLDTNVLDFTNKGIEVVNTGTAVLNLTWTRCFMDTLGVELNLCNSGDCMAGLPLAYNMPPIVSGSKGWIKFHVQTFKVPYTSTVKYILKNGVTQTDTLTYVFVVATPTTGINEINKINSTVKVYPNPVSDVLVVDSKIENSSLQLLDVNGAIALSKNIKSGLNKIDVKEIAAGNYFYKISNDKNPISGKIIITR